MTAELTKLYGSIHLSTVLLFTVISVPEVSEFVFEKWAMTGMLVMLIRCAISIHRGRTVPFLSGYGVQDVCLVRCGGNLCHSSALLCMCGDYQHGWRILK